MITNKDSFDYSFLPDSHLIQGSLDVLSSVFESYARTNLQTEDSLEAIKGHIKYRRPSGLTFAQRKSEAFLVYVLPYFLIREGDKNVWEFPEAKVVAEFSREYFSTKHYRWKKALFWKLGFCTPRKAPVAVKQSSRPGLEVMAKEITKKVTDAVNRINLELNAHIMPDRHVWEVVEEVILYGKGVNEHLKDILSFITEGLRPNADEHFHKYLAMVKLPKQLYITKEEFNLKWAGQVIEWLKAKFNTVDEDTWTRLAYLV